MQRKQLFIFQVAANESLELSNLIKLTHFAVTSQIKMAVIFHIESLIKHAHDSPIIILQ